MSGYGVTDAVDTACRSVRDRLRRAHPEHGPATSDGRRVIKIECLKPAGWPDPWLSGPVFVTGFVGTLRRAWFATLAFSILECLKAFGLVLPVVVGPGLSHWLRWHPPPGVVRNVPPFDLFNVRGGASKPQVETGAQWTSHAAHKLSDRAITAAHPQHPGSS